MSDLLNTSVVGCFCFQWSKKKGFRVNQTGHLVSKCCTDFTHLHPIPCLDPASVLPRPLSPDLQAPLLFQLGAHCTAAPLYVCIPYNWRATFLTGCSHRCTGLPSVRVCYCSPPCIARELALYQQMAGRREEVQISLALCRFHMCAFVLMQ